MDEPFGRPQMPRYISPKERDAFVPDKKMSLSTMAARICSIRAWTRLWLKDTDGFVANKTEDEDTRLFSGLVIYVYFTTLKSIISSARFSSVVTILWQTRRKKPFHNRLFRRFLFTLPLLVPFHQLFTVSLAIDTDDFDYFGWFKCFWEQTEVCFTRMFAVSKAWFFKRGSR